MLLFCLLLIKDNSLAGRLKSRPITEAIKMTNTPISIFEILLFEDRSRIVESIWRK